MKYVRRWAVQGLKPNGDRATTIFDLLYGRQRVMVYPATLDTFAVAVEGEDFRGLAAAAQSQIECTVAASHAEHGARTLGLRPYDTAAMELFVMLPRKSMHIVYARERLKLLTETFGYILDWIQ
jgi:hypothetical protein